MKKDQLFREHALRMNRRSFLSKASIGLGTAALSSLFGVGCGWQREQDSGLIIPETSDRGLTGLPHFAPKAKRVIYLFHSGGPSQLELFDYKPVLNQLDGKDCPQSLLE